MKIVAFFYQPDLLNILIPNQIRKQNSKIFSLMSIMLIAARQGGIIVPYVWEI